MDDTSWFVAGQFCSLINVYIYKHCKIDEVEDKQLKKIKGNVAHG